MNFLSVMHESLQRYSTTQDFNFAEYEQMAAALINFEHKSNPKLLEPQVIKYI